MFILLAQCQAQLRGISVVSYQAVQFLPASHAPQVYPSSCSTQVTTSLSVPGDTMFSLSVPGDTKFSLNVLADTRFSLSVPADTMSLTLKSPFAKHSAQQLS